MRAHNIGFDVLTEAYYKNRNVITNPTLAHDGSPISWEGNKGVVERSDFGSRPTFRQVFYDALDLGLSIRSPRTGQEIVFVVTGEDKDHRENEITGWRLESLGPNGRPDGKYKLLVIND